MFKLAVCPLSELQPGQRKIVRHQQWKIGVFNVRGNIHAYRNICPHAGAPVCEGEVTGTTLPSPVYHYDYGREGCILRCPWHGWEFDLESGEHLTDPSLKLKPLRVEVEPCAAERSEDLERFTAVIEEGMIHVVLPGHS